MTLGERIAYYRGKLGLSQGELAEKLSVSRQAVSKWETDAGLPDLALETQRGLIDLPFPNCLISP